jgi:glycine/D-amino acid oxidase-like deaminating enzyme
VKRSVVVVGGGIMGCACAWELARLGLSVILFERSVPGAEASSAAAGIVGASVEYADDGPLARLARESRRLYPSFVRDLQRRTGIDPEYRECGVLEVDFRKRPAREAARRRRRSPPRLLDGRALRRLEPALSDRIVTGVLQIFYHGIYNGLQHFRLVRHFRLQLEDNALQSLHRRQIALALNGRRRLMPQGDKSRFVAITKSGL